MLSFGANVLMLDIDWRKVEEFRKDEEARRKDVDLLKVDEQSAIKYCRIPV